MHFTNGQNELILLKSRGGSGNDIRPLCQSDLANEQEKSPADLLRICPRLIWSDKLVFSDTEVFHCFAPHLVISNSRKGVENDCQFSFTFSIHSVEVWMTVQGRQDWGNRRPKSRMLTFAKQGAKETLSYVWSCFISRENLSGISCTRDKNLLLQLLWPNAASRHWARPLLKSVGVLFLCWPAEFVLRQTLKRKSTELNTGK